jgi:hypothetical protein
VCLGQLWNSKYTKGGESLGDEESSKEEEEVVPALILASGARPLAPDVNHISVTRTSQVFSPALAGAGHAQIFIQEDER